MFARPVSAMPREGSKSVLFVISSEKQGAGDTRPGFEMDELAQAWDLFRSNGVRTAFASPRGGAVAADKFNPDDPANARFLADPDAIAGIANSLPLAGVDAGAYDAVYIVGGKGAMFDLAVNPELARLVAQSYQRGAVVAAICHGSAALANVRLADGRHLVAGRAVTGFTAEEDALFGKRWSKDYPFGIEAKLRERGARWVESPLMMPGVAVDGRLITGQNPYSTGLVADAVLRALDIVPAARTPRRDEASMALAERAVAGDPAVASELVENTARFHPELIAIVGHYQLQVAETPTTVRAALAVMELAAPHVGAEELSVSRAEAMRRLGRIAEARRVLSTVLAEKPGMVEALELQSRLQASP
ncbi:type 1 glutamine amidotransferase domain-containing protein [Lysobacter sp. D1-1-M9]|uniref:type 1 glutamine amidotransferase domain-containing protein n=1 Tax=Novilysobacter longmucuonensis TaxID=3098603 RepID=UPI002FCBD0F4